jgi:hypothetical protein
VIDALFVHESGLFVPTELARSPWTDRALHGGPPGALIARAIEAMDGAAWWVVRLTIDIMGEIPVVPLRVQTELERGGRRVQLVEGKVTTAAGEALMRAFAWRVRRIEPLALPPPVDLPPPTPPLPATLPPFRQRFREYVDFFGEAVEKRLYAGEALAPGRAGMWFRLRVPVVLGEPTSPLQTLMAAVDSANGISWTIPFEQYLFPNTDIGVYLAREPEGEWIALDAVSYLDPGGRGISDTALFDTRGFIGRANQVLFVGERE